MKTKVLLENVQTDERFFEEVHTRKPAGRKNKSGRSPERWFQEVLEDASLLDDEACPADCFTKDDWIELLTTGLLFIPDYLVHEDCPRDEFTPEDWAELLENSPYVLEYIPDNIDITPFVGKSTFSDWSSEDIYAALTIGCKNIVRYFNLSELEQEHFDLLCGGPEEWSSKDDFLDFMKNNFPYGVPEHLHLQPGFPKEWDNALHSRL